MKFKVKKGTETFDKLCALDIEIQSAITAIGEFIGQFGAKKWTHSKGQIVGRILGIHLDEGQNNLRGSGIREINVDESLVKVLVVPTNEELEIAQQCYTLLNG